MSAILSPAQQYYLLSNVERSSGGAIDPSTLSLRQIAAIRGAMWTVRGAWQYGPRPGQPSNVTALEYLYSYGDPYNPMALGGAFNLNDEQQAMLRTYCSFGYTHACIGPVTAQSYRGHYPDYFFDTPERFECFLDWLQCLWDYHLIPIVFMHPDNWTLEQTQELYEPLIRGNARAQRLIRACVPSGWEPAYYNWSSETWARYFEWGHDLLPDALICCHTVPDVDAPGGTDELGDDNGAGNDKVWARVCPTIHGWLHQASSFANPNEHGDPNHPTKSNYDNWADLFAADCPYSFYNRFHFGYAGWPTCSLWGPNEPIYLYAGEYCAYWNYHDNRAYAEGEAWGDRAVSVGADGYLDSGAGTVPQRPETFVRMAPMVTVDTTVREPFTVSPLTPYAAQRRGQRLIR
ncbi:MAG TPA: hypothetical protein VKB41_05090 [Steroidobacteraceae bacterium]|nr:hypothetical protein [Steroidobacteraceae bacterium]